MRRFLYGTTRPGSTTTPRLGDLRPGICSWTRSHLVWRVRPPPSRFGGSRSAGSPKHGLWSRGPISNTSLDVLPCPQHSGYPRGASLTSGTSYMRCYRAPATRGGGGVRTSALPQHGFPPPTLLGARAARNTFESPLRSSSHAHSYSSDAGEVQYRDVHLQRHRLSRHILLARTTSPTSRLRWTTTRPCVSRIHPGMSNACSMVGWWGGEFGYGSLVEPLRTSRTSRSSVQIGDLSRGSTVIRDSLVPAFS